LEFPFREIVDFFSCRFRGERYILNTYIENATGEGSAAHFAAIENFIHRGSHYDLLPDQKLRLLATDKALAKVRDRLLALTAEPGETKTFSLLAALTKVTNLKKLNDISDDYADSQIQAGFKALAENDIFGKELFPEENSFLGAFQKSEIGVQLSEDTTDIPKGELSSKNRFAQLEGDDWKIEAYEVSAKKSKSRLKEALFQAEKAGEAKLSAEVKRLYIRVTGTPDPAVLDRFLMNLYRELTNASRYSETELSQRRPRDKEGKPQVFETKKTQVKEYVDYVLKKIDEEEAAGNVDIATALYKQAANVIGSFQLTENGLLQSPEEMYQDIDEAQKKVSQAFADFGDLDSLTSTLTQKQLDALKELESLDKHIRNARRAITGHSKFNAPGRPILQSRVQTPLSSPGHPRRAEMNGSFYADGDTHDVGKNNVNQTILELMAYKESKRTTKDWEKLLYNTGNERDKQLGLSLHIFSHPESAAKEIDNLAKREFQFNRFIKFLTELKTQLQLKQKVKEGKIDLPPPPIRNFLEQTDFSSTEQIKIKLTELANEISEKNVEKNEYKSYGRGGDEMVALTNNEYYIGFFGFLVDILTDGLAGNDVTLASGFGLSQEITSASTLEDVSEQASQAQLITKAVKGISLEELFEADAPFLKYSYVHGKPLTSKAAKLVLKGIRSQIRLANSETSLVKLNKLAAETNKDFWGDAFWLALESDKAEKDKSEKAIAFTRDWEKLQRELQALNPKKPQYKALTPSNTTVVLAQLKSLPEAREYYVDRLLPLIDAINKKTDALETLGEIESSQLRLYKTLKNIVFNPTNINPVDEGIREKIELFEDTGQIIKEIAEAPLPTEEPRLRPGTLNVTINLLTLLYHPFSGKKIFSRKAFEENRTFLLDRYKNLIVGIIAPVIEEVALYFVFFSVFGGNAYLLGRLGFAVWHVIQNSVLDKEGDAKPFDKFFLPAFISTQAYVALLGFGSTALLGVVPIFFVVGLLAHITANLSVTFKGTVWQKVLLGVQTLFMAYVLSTYSIVLFAFAFVGVSLAALGFLTHQAYTLQRVERPAIDKIERPPIDFEIFAQTQEPDAAFFVGEDDLYKPVLPPVAPVTEKELLAKGPIGEEVDIIAELEN